MGRSGAPMKRQRVLVVEDEAEVREVYRRLFGRLKAEGFTVVIVPDGEQALGVLMHEPVDIVLLDWALPGISGASLAKALRSHARTRGIGILMVTALASPDETVAALESGADDHLAKPFDEKVLLARLHSLVRRREPTFGANHSRRFPGLRLDLDAERLDLDGRRVALTRK